MQPGVPPRGAHGTARDQPGRRDEGDGAQRSGPLGGVAHRDAPAERVAEHGRALQSQLGARLPRCARTRLRGRSSRPGAEATSQSRAGRSRRRAGAAASSGSSRENTWRRSARPCRSTSGGADSSPARATLNPAARTSLESLATAALATAAVPVAVARRSLTAALAGVRELLLVADADRLRGDLGAVLLLRTRA